MLLPIELFGIGGFGFVIYKTWREWLGHADERPSVHIAGADDEDIDFAAALRSIGGLPR